MSSKPSDKLSPSQAKKSKRSFFRRLSRSSSPDPHPTTTKSHPAAIVQGGNHLGTSLPINQTGKTPVSISNVTASAPSQGVSQSLGAPTSVPGQTPTTVLQNPALCLPTQAPNITQTPPSPTITPSSSTNSMIGQVGSSVTTVTTSGSTGSPVANPSPNIPAASANSKLTLWDKAVESLSAEEQKLFNISGQGRIDILFEVETMTNEKMKLCEEKQWKVKWGGRMIVVRDVANKILVWVNKFKEIGDTVVQYDTAHGALPWAAIRLVLQLAVNESQTVASMLLGIERVSHLVDRCKIYETLYLKPDFQQLTSIRELENTLHNLYGRILQYLIRAYKFFVQNTVGRLVTSALCESPTESFLKESDDWEKDLLKLITTINMEILQMDICDLRKDVQDEDRRLQGLLQSLDQPITRIDYNSQRLVDALNDEERSNILKWLSVTRYIEHYQFAISGLVEATGEWLLATDEYIDWRASSSSAILWLRGDPGVGKTKLTAFVIKTLSVDDPDTIAYFLCKRDENERRSLLPILRALVKQLSLQKSTNTIDDLLIKEYETDKRNGFSQGPPNLQKCQELLRQLIDQKPIRYLVIDALDECERDDRMDIINLFKDLIGESKSLLKVFISSRNERDISVLLEDDVSYRYISPKDNNKDIASFITADLEERITKRKLLGGKVSKELRSDIESTLNSMADGMFQWVKLSLEHMCNLLSERQLRVALGKLPKGLDAAYDQVWSLIAEQDDNYRMANNIMKWIMASYSPVKPSQLATVFSLINQEDSSLLEVENILAICHNLVVLDHEENVLRFSHLSVREYLDRNKITIEEAHAFVGETCIRFISESQTHDIYEKAYPKSKDGSKDKSHATRYGPPFSGKTNNDRAIIRYCLRSWPYHFEACNSQNKADSPNIILTEFLGTQSEPCTKFQKWCNFLACMYIFQLYKEINQPRGYHKDIDRTLVQTSKIIQRLNTPLALLCCFNMPISYQDFWDQDWPLRLLKADEIAALLYVASVFDRMTIFQKLPATQLKDSIQQARADELPLVAATLWGREGIAKLLIELGANVNHGDTYGTPIGYAAGQENIAIVQILLANGANISGMPDGDPSDDEANNSHKITRKILLDFGLDEEVFAGTVTRAVRYAAQSGNTSTVQLLLDKGADINMPCGGYGSPLECAICMEDISVVQLLLDRGADINMPGGDFGSPLGCAVRFLNMSIIQLLLDRGANINMPGGYFGSPLGCAADHGDVSMIQFLLDRGADINMPCGDWGTTLGHAIFAGDKETTNLLLKHGAKFSSVEEALKENIRRIQVLSADGTTSQTSITRAQDVNAPDVTQIKYMHLLYNLGAIQLLQKSYDAASETFAKYCNILTNENVQGEFLYCDICSSSPPTPWIKCADCTSFDLCKACYSNTSSEKSPVNGGHDGHQFVHINKDGKVVSVSDVHHLDLGD